MTAVPLDPVQPQAGSTPSEDAPAPARDLPASCAAPSPPQSPAPPEGPLRVSYTEIAQESGTRFVRKVYQLILGRSPDDRALNDLGQALRSGKMTKAEIVLHLRWSAEGRARGVRVKGLLRPLCAAALRKIPGVGRLFPSRDQIQTRITEAEERFNSSLAKLLFTFNESRREWAAHIEEVIHPRLEALETRLDDVSAQVGNLSALAQGPLADLMAKDLPGHLAEQAQAIALLRQMLADTQRFVTRLIHEAAGTPPQGPTIGEAIRSLPEPVSQHGSDTEKAETQAEPEAPSGFTGANLGLLYAALEDAFRGSSEAIRERLRFYLPYLRRVPLDLAPVPVVDVGCGRGEWLELLQDEGIAALGVDLNPVMVDRCREKGLHVVEGDATAYVRSLGPGNVGVITAFHLIEHLALEDLVRFLDAAYESLMPGGLLICETPNPENITVSAYSFYLDPTHRHPLPPPLARFLCEFRGFARVEVVRPPNPNGETPEASTLHPRLRTLLFKENDYAVIAQKAPCDHAL